MAKFPPLIPPVIRPLREADIDAVFARAGGGRAHPDVDRRTDVGADYRLGDAVIELKMLDDEGLQKPERQAKLAALFARYQEGRPVIVLDPLLLPQARRVMRRSWKGLLVQPYRRDVLSLSNPGKKIRMSRQQSCSLSTTASQGLTQEELVEHVARRAKNDSREIDGIVVRGCYFHSDGFDTVALWPLDYVPIHLERPFAISKPLEFPRGRSCRVAYDRFCPRSAWI